MFMKAEMSSMAIITSFTFWYLTNKKNYIAFGINVCFLQILLFCKKEDWICHECGWKEHLTTGVITRKLIKITLLKLHKFKLIIN